MHSSTDLRPHFYGQSPISHRRASTSISMSAILSEVKSLPGTRTRCPGLEDGACTRHSTRPSQQHVASMASTSLPSLPKFSTYPSRHHEQPYFNGLRNTQGTSDPYLKHLVIWRRGRGNESLVTYCSILRRQMYNSRSAPRIWNLACPSPWYCIRCLVQARPDG
jgi:hypothetical protein